MVTRVSRSENMSEQVYKQLMNNSKPMTVAGCTLFGLGIIPGMPNIVFLLMAMVLFYIAYYIDESQQELTKEQLERANEKEGLFIVSKFANDFFQDTLWNNDEGKLIGLGYFRERGFKDEIIKKFQLGYSPKKKDFFSNTAIKKGYDQECLLTSGLSLLNADSNTLIDRFKERAIFPIHSYSGRILGFGGRAFNLNAKAKYLNSPETLIYHKSKVLYGLNIAKSTINKNDLCYIVEGYTDVISMHQNGIENVVSASGTALSEEQIKLIKRLTQNIVLLFDGDEAGIKATYKSINLILKQDMNVKVVVFPENEDPDSLSQKLSAKKFQDFINGMAFDFIDYKIKTSKMNSISDPNKITKIKRGIIESISYIPDDLKRSQYCTSYSKKLDLKEEVLLKEISKFRKKTPERNNTINLEKTKLENKKPNIENKNTSKSRLYKLEEEVIRILVNYGNNSFLYNGKEETVAALIINEINIDHIKFYNNTLANLYNEIIYIIESRGKIDQKYFITHKNRDISQKIVDLISHKHNISSNWINQHKIYTGREDEKIKKTTEKAILALKKGHIEEKIFELQQKIKKENTNVEEIKQLSELIKIKAAISKSLGRNVG